MKRLPLSTCLLAVSAFVGVFLGVPVQAQMSQVFAFSCQLPNSPATCPNGESPANMIQASDGNFYGTAIGGATNISDVIFRLTPTGEVTVLFGFAASDNSSPDSSLLEAPDGSLWGTASGGGGNSSDIGFVYKINKDGSGFQIVHGFPRSFATATRFHETLTLGSDGNIYGSSIGDGVFSESACPYGCGEIYRIAPLTGTFALLHQLNGISDGAGPSGMIQASDRNFYGVTANAVFRVTASGSFKLIVTLPDFTFGNVSGGRVGVIQSHNGALIGLMQNSALEPEFFAVSLKGTGFKTGPALQPLHLSSLLSNLLQVADGSIWFTSSGPNFSDGSVVQVSRFGVFLQNIVFNGTNGQNPNSAPILGVDAKLYGTAQYGGLVSSGTASGIVYSVNP